MKPLPADQWDASLQGVLDDMSGRPLNIHCLMANHPALLLAWWQLRMYLVRGGDLDQRDSELVILRVAVLTGTWYEWAAHVDRGLRAGLSRVEIQRIAAGATHPDWDRRDAVLIAAVDELVNDTRIQAATLEELGTFFTPRRILDIVSLQGLYMNLACMIQTFGLDIEDWLAARLPDDVNEQTFAELSAAHGH